ncbi:2-keto-4-pentenoate hydratase [Paenibacillus rigui]|uniref:2-keto-4-pentenoate hydratase n=1 Tax=Paenibacillus rigui TaxID=554312 RepID=A0A229UU10_9BACL|nr:2-keto-4-pentenoate hydratase [Paenibacillus rigui]OXM87006.1 2-keto-4-pentenoate hydratase [Paenibacillus rigui]
MVAPLTDIYPHLTVDDAYQIQLKGIARKLGEGRQIVGKKIGLTSVAMQELLGVDQPDYGHLLDHMEVSNRGMIPVSSLFQPKAEAEIAFVLHTDLKGPSVTVEDVLNATEYIVPALEIVDSRITDWTIKLEDTIADNASSGLFVLGNETFSAKEMDLTKVTMDLLRNGQFINSGSGSAVLGNPAACVAWLANALHDYGVRLEAGEVILSGALSAAIAVQQGDRVTADFHHLGTVEVTFI